MARNEKKAPDRVPSRAEEDLARRTEEGYVPDSAVGGTAVLNPNPFGAEEYVGTDPIYQNYANDVNKPLAAEEGVEAEQLKAHKEMHEVDEANAVEDPGTGGVTEKAATGTGGATFRTVLPGQEGYDREKAEEQNGPALRVYNDEDASSDSEDSDGVEEVGPEEQPVATPAAPLVAESSGDDSNVANDDK